MIEFKITPPEETERICKTEGISFVPETEAYAAFEGGKPLGRIVFAMNGGSPEIEFVDAGETVIADGLIRCALNYMLTRGAKEAVCSCKVDERLLKRLGFEKRDGALRAPVSEKMFRCGHKPE